MTWLILSLAVGPATQKRALKCIISKLKDFILSEIAFTLKFEILDSEPKDKRSRKYIRFPKVQLLLRVT